MYHRHPPLVVQLCGTTLGLRTMDLYKLHPTSLFIGGEDTPMIRLSAEKEKDLSFTHTFGS